MAQLVKNQPANAGDEGSIPGLGRSPGEVNNNPLQYSCLRNPMNGGPWKATVHGVAVRYDLMSKPLLLFLFLNVYIYTHTHIFVKISSV